jgi:hypothetical protein
MSEDGVRAEVDAVFKKFKVSTEPPNEAVLLARRVAFGILSVAVGAAAQENKFTADLIRATNLIF